jgi:Flp pilus assembly protein CpaB
MAKRSNLILTIGLAVFVIGAGATFFVVRGGGGNKAAATGNNSTVLYAAKDIPSGTTGAQAVDQGYIKTRSIGSSAKPAGALSDPSEVAGKTAQGTVAEGSVITSSQFAAPQTSLGSVKIPDGKMALALSMAPAPGVAGYVAAGDHIDVFGVIKDGPGSPSAKLVMQNTEVLSVSPSGGTAAAAAAATGASPTYLLAVSAPEAEHLVFLTSFDSLYFSLVSKDAAAVAPTPGSGAADALKQLS